LFDRFIIKLFLSVKFDIVDVLESDKFASKRFYRVIGKGSSQTMLSIIQRSEDYPVRARPSAENFIGILCQFLLCNDFVILLH